MTSQSESGFDIKGTYDSSDLADVSAAIELGEPGEYPYTRGVYASMYTGKP